MIRGQTILKSSMPEVQKLDAKAYSIELQRHEAAYNHNNIHAPESDKETVVSVGALVLGATEKTTPVNADMIPVMDTADSNKIRKLSWANIKATLKAYFDTLYATASTVTFPGFGTTGSTACVGNDSRLSDSRTPVAHNHTAANVTDFASVALSSAPAETTTTIGALINGAAAITAPDDADTIVMRNHTGGLLHKMTWAYVKSVLKTYFDALYDPLNNTAWTAYTPAVQPVSGSFTAASATGAYKQIGKTVFCRIIVTVTTIGTGSGGIIASLPVTALAANSGAIWGGRESAAYGFPLWGWNANTVQVYFYQYSGAGILGSNGAVYNLTGIYEAA